MLMGLLILTWYLFGGIREEWHRSPKRHPFRMVKQKGGNPWCGIRKGQKVVWAGKPTYRIGLGTSGFKIATKSPQAQRWFNQGLNYLHSFWHLEAYRAFQEVVRLDTTAAMGYWGIAMSQPGFASDDPSPWRKAIVKARRLASVPIEKALIEASYVLLHQGVDAALPLFSQLAIQYPDEPEVLAFAYLFMRQTSQDMKGAFGDGLKRQLTAALQRFPQHVGLMHYYIHLLELRPDFAEALPVSEKMARLAPRSPHLVHMPGHLYYLQGAYGTAVKAFEKALQVEEAYHRSTKRPFSENQNYIHNLHYLTVALAEDGRYEAALEKAHQVARLTLAGSEQTANRLLLLYEGRLLPARVHFRFRQWAAAAQYLAQLLQSPDAPPDERFVQRYLWVMQAFALGMLAVEEGKTQAAKQYLAQMTDWMRDFNDEGWALEGKMEFQLLNETYDIMEMARLELLGWHDNLDPTQPYNPFAFYEALRWEQRIPYDEPPRLTYPMSESLGRLHVKRGDWEAARMAFGVALRQRPNSPNIQRILSTFQETRKK